MNKVKKGVLDMTFSSSSFDETVIDKAIAELGGEG